MIVLVLHILSPSHQQPWYSHINQAITSQNWTRTVPTDLWPVYMWQVIATNLVWSVAGHTTDILHYMNPELKLPTTHGFRFSWFNITIWNKKTLGFGQYHCSLCRQAISSHGTYWPGMEWLATTYSLHYMNPEQEIATLWSLGQYHGCWCPGSLCRQVISNHGINLVLSSWPQPTACTVWTQNRNYQPPLLLWVLPVQHNPLTHCGLVMPYDDTNLGQHLLR